MNNIFHPLRLFRNGAHFPSSKACFSWKSVRNSSWTRVIISGSAVVAGIAGMALPVFASEMQAHPSKLPWCHNGILSTYDHASVRRGYQVYKEVCAACHSMKYIAYRHLVDAVLTEAEAKEEAANIQVIDGPDDKGEMFERPGRLTDSFPKPYANTEAARAANNGAAPPDLTYITKARHGFEDYVFHLLTGYCDAPPGREVAEPQYYNPYFPGGAISMARPLYDELLEYADGTPASTSQMAKDVVSFLCWSADRNHDQRKRVLFKALIITGIVASVLFVMKRKRWSTIKTRKLMYKNRPVPKDL